MDNTPLTSCIRPRRWSGFQEIASSNGHWIIRFVLQGSFSCPTQHLSFDLEHRTKPEKLDGGRIQRPAVQTAKEGRWHVYHLTIEGREEEMKSAEERRRNLGGSKYEWQNTLLLHESRILNKVLVDKVITWLLSSTEHQKWFGAQREDKQTKAFFVNEGDWTTVKNIQSPHEMIFIGHPEQPVKDIVEAYRLQSQAMTEELGESMTCPCVNGKWCIAEKEFNHGCVLSKFGNVCAVKDVYGFVLVVRELQSKRMMGIES